MYKKIVNPIKRGKGSSLVYATIIIEDGGLSICGSGISKSRNYIDTIRNGKPAKGWTREMLEKFCNIWEEWHLNNLRPYCSHQKQLGWDKIATEEVTLYIYRLTKEAESLANSIKQASLDALNRSETVTLTPEQANLTSLPYIVTTYEEMQDENASYYELRSTQKKMLTWISPNEHPRGILMKPCPVCGYEFGSAWKKEQLPRDVEDFLKSLPAAKEVPTWAA